MGNVLPYHRKFHIPSPTQPLTRFPPPPHLSKYSHQPSSLQGSQGYSPLDIFTSKQSLNVVKVRFGSLRCFIICHKLLQVQYISRYIYLESFHTQVKILDLFLYCLNYSKSVFSFYRDFTNIIWLT